MNDGDQKKVIKQSRPMVKTATIELINTDEPATASPAAPAAAQLSPQALLVEETAMTPIKSNSNDRTRSLEVLLDPRQPQNDQRSNLM